MKKQYDNYATRSYVMNQLFVQEDIFWEDDKEDCDIDNIDAAKDYFEVIRMDTTTILDLRLQEEKRSDIKEAGWRGSLTMARMLGVKFEFTDCLNWMPALKPYILNRDYRFMDMQSIVEEPWNGRRFIRPVSGFKSFSGFDYSHEKFVDEFRFLTINHNGNPFEICVVSEPKKIDREYRCIFVDRELVGSSRYMVNHELDVSSEVGSSVVDFANILARSSYFDNIFNFVLDVAEVDGNMFLLEVNAFETSSFYGANMNEIYKKLKNSKNA